MTSPQIIRATEDSNPWIGMDHRLLLVSEKRSRLPGRGDRLLLILAYSFIVLALCLFLSDFCRLMFHLQFDPDLQSSTSMRQAHQIQHVRKHV